ncbi:hypothetical protein ACIQVZ_36115, partial [Kitasatospora sp. NPDC098663]
MSAQGQAGRILGHLLGYLDSGRGRPDAPRVLANRHGQYLHLIGHSFGGRFLCEAVQYAADPPGAELVLSARRPEPSVHRRQRPSAAPRKFVEGSGPFLEWSALVGPVERAGMFV